MKTHLRSLIWERVQPHPDISLPISVLLLRTFPFLGMFILLTLSQFSQSTFTPRKLNWTNIYYAIQITFSFTEKRSILISKWLFTHWISHQKPVTFINKFVTLLPSSSIERKISTYEEWLVFTALPGFVYRLALMGQPRRTDILILLRV